MTDGVKRTPMPLVVFDGTYDGTLTELQAEIEAAGYKWAIEGHPNEPHPDGHRETKYVTRVYAWCGDGRCSGFAEPEALLAEAYRRFKEPVRRYQAGGTKAAAVASMYTEKRQP